MDSQGLVDRDEIELKLSVKFAGRSIPVEIAASSTIGNLKHLLQNLTNVLPRGQKLIFKGKVLSDGSTLASSDLRDGSKIMLMSSQGVHQGVCFVKKESLVSPRVERVIDRKKGKEDYATKSQIDRWKATGVIALSDCHLSIFEKGEAHTSVFVIGFGFISDDNAGNTTLTILRRLQPILRRRRARRAWTADQSSSNFSLFSSASASVERSSFASDAPDQDSASSVLSRVKVLEKTMFSKM